MISLSESQDVEEQFNKQYEFTVENSIKKTDFLLSSNEDFQDYPPLQNLKKELNDVKSKLSDVEISSWHKHTTCTNPACEVVYKVRKNFCPELCTQAWCKFYDLLSNTNIIPQDINNNTQKTIKSLHLCEAPGAFITALNHYVKCNYEKLNLEWLATTLNPYYEGNFPGSCIVDDRLIYLTPNMWYFGDDDTGDILNIANIKKTCENVREKFSNSMVDLVTADGSINCQNNPEEQETIVGQLLYCETLTALKCLRPNGSFVLKAFTFFEKCSIVLLYILNLVFRSVVVRKPSVSKPGNSEVYIIATGFIGVDQCQDLLHEIKSHLNQSNVDSLFSWVSGINVKESFLLQVEECAKLFSFYQIKTIEENLVLFKRRLSRKERQMQNRVKSSMYETYRNKCQLSTLTNDQCLVKSGVLRHLMQSNVIPRSYLKGSYKERMGGMTRGHRLPQCAYEKQNWTLPIKEADIFSANLEDVKVGQMVTEIHFSLFCSTLFIENCHPINKNNNKIKLYDQSNGTKNLSIQSTSRLLNILQKHHHICKLDFKNFATDLLSTILQTSCLVDNKCTNVTVNEEFICHGMLVASLTDGNPFNLIEDFLMLLKVCIFVGKNLAEGSSSVFLLPPVLRRTTASVLYLLRHMFKEISIFPIFLQDGPKLLTAIAFIGTIYKGHKESMEFLTRVHDRSLTIDPLSEKEIVEVVPVQTLLQDKDFVNLLKSANERLLQEAANAEVTNM